MRARLTFLLLAWLSAFVIVTVLFLALGTHLTQRPLVVRALIVSGVLVVMMTQIVLPLINRVLRRR
jgi:antibiotic biosynthesis monooxygenase (ABM) superfamily enzyme